MSVCSSAAVCLVPQKHTSHCFFLKFSRKPFSGCAPIISPKICSCSFYFELHCWQNLMHGSLDDSTGKLQVKKLPTFTFASCVCRFKARNRYTLEAAHFGPRPSEQLETHECATMFMQLLRLDVKKCKYLFFFFQPS